MHEDHGDKLHTFPIFQIYND